MPKTEKEKKKKAETLSWIITFFICLPSSNSISEQKSMGFIQIYLYRSRTLDAILFLPL